jgi:uncharacterized lipoprotein YmbA
MRTLLDLAIALVFAVLAGCASQQSTFYTLKPEMSGEPVHPATSIAVTVGLVTVPELIDRPQIVVFEGANQVHINEFARWAEPLKSQIPRVVAADLAALLNTPRVSTSPIAEEQGMVYRVRIDVQRFDATLGDAATVDAVWSVSPPGKGALLAGRSTVREPCTGEGYDALVAAYSRALATLSRDIASRIIQVQTP